MLRARAGPRGPHHRRASTALSTGLLGAQKRRAGDGDDGDDWGRQRHSGGDREPRSREMLSPIERVEQILGLIEAEMSLRKSSGFDGFNQQRLALLMQDLTSALGACALRDADVAPAMSAVFRAYRNIFEGNHGSVRMSLVIPTFNHDPLLVARFAPVVLSAAMNTYRGGAVVPNTAAVLLILEDQVMSRGVDIGRAALLSAIAPDRVFTPEISARLVDPTNHLNSGITEQQAHEIVRVMLEIYNMPEQSSTIRAETVGMLTRFTRAQQRRRGGDGAALEVFLAAARLFRPRGSGMGASQ